jgi:hypothetical protein
VSGIGIDILLVATLPFVLRSGKQVVIDLFRDIKAKKALESEVLRIARANPSVREAIASAAGNPAQAIEASTLITRAAAKLDKTDAESVQRALGQGERQGRANYIDDIARHVNSRLAREHTDANPPSTITTA